MKNSILGLLLTGWAAAAAAQAPEPPPTREVPSFRESVQVRVMDLDVSATDSRGRPVPDLKKEEFTIRVDGKPVPIDYFTRVEQGTIHAPDLAAASPERVLEEYRKGPDAYVPRHFLVYFDLGHLSPSGRKRGVDALRDLATRLGPGDSARVVSFDRRPRTLCEWSAGKDDLFAALDKIESSGVAQSRLMTEMQTLHDIDSTRSRSTRSALARNYGQQERAEVQTLLVDLNAELATLTALGGKKAVLFVTGGFDMQPGYAMSQYAVGNFSLASFDTRDMSAELGAVVKRANSSDITFYTVDARGLVGEGTSASEDDPLLSRSGIGFTARQNSQAGLIELARQTGGLALLNSNDVRKGIEQVYEDSSTYYSVGVNLSALPTGGYRDVKIDVSRPGVTVRARRGFAPRSREDRAKDVTQAVLRSNAEFKAIPVSMFLAPPTKAKKYYELPVKLSVPASSLTFSSDGSSSRATADLYIAVIDDSGAMSSVGHEEAIFTIPGATVPADARLSYTMPLQIRKGNARVVVNVQDRETGKMGTAKADVKVE